MKKNTSFPQNMLTRLLAFASLFGVLFFTSCSEDPVQTEADIVPVSQDLVVSLKADPTEPIIIDDVLPTEVHEKRANNSGGNDRGRFNISLRYVVPATAAQQAVFDEAAGRWEEIIIKDVPSINGPIPSAFIGFPDIEGTIDDVIIEVALAPIDGPGGILGQAGPRFVRTADFLTISGVMFFDVDDLDFLDQLGLFEEVIVHEMGHVLGVGTLWNVEPFFNRTLIAGPDSSPYFTGHKANVHWNAEGGEFELPIEGDFGPGTAFGHWDEAALNNELMTGFLNLGENPLSRITAGSMKDLGYGASNRGESYDLPKGTPGVDISTLGDMGTADNPGLNIANREILLEPIGFVQTSKD